MKTSELTGAALDWAVAKCENKIEAGPFGSPEVFDDELHLRYCEVVLDSAYLPSTDWAQGGPIIERKGLHLRKSGCEWQCDYWNDSTRNFDTSYGPTLLIAAMRCYCSAKLGDDIDVPKELT